LLNLSYISPLQRKYINPQRERIYPLWVKTSYTDNAQVVSIEDVYREHTIKQPYQDCYTKEFRQRVSGDGSATNEIFGGILGGAIGNQFGGGSGKKVMTVAGALLGASIANDNERVGYKVVNKQICVSLWGTKLILGTNLITQNCTKGTV
jgi:uncharacterized protein YcfJ